MDMPPTRYRVVEKGRRLIVIDRLRGERVESRIVDSLERRSPRRVETRDRSALAPAPTTARGAEPRRSTGSGAQAASGMVLTTQRWFDDRGPRRIRVDSDGEGKLAIGNGILTVENEDQALARARPDEKDKGGEAAKAALAMLALRERFAG